MALVALGVCEITESVVFALSRVVVAGVEGCVVLALATLARYIYRFVCSDIHAYLGRRGGS